MFRCGRVREDDFLMLKHEIYAEVSHVPVKAAERGKIADASCLERLVEWKRGFEYR